MDKNLKKVWDYLTDEQKEKAKDCKTMEEFATLANEEKFELSDEVMNMVSGGVQAGLITQGGSGEFGPKKPEKPKPHKPTWF